MKTKLCTICVLVIAALLRPQTSTSSPPDVQAKPTLQELRTRLANLQPGMSSDDVLKVLGKPDEIRRVPADHLLDGTRLLSEHKGIGQETERWAYGILAPGKFASIGFVSLDSNGKVVAAVAPDCFSNPNWKLPDLVPAPSDQAVTSPLKRSCNVGPVQLIPAEGETASSLATTVTLKNSGAKDFVLKRDAAYSMRRFLLVEVYDSKGTMLYRNDEMRAHSPLSLDSNKWPVLSIPANKEITENLAISPSLGFGALPPGQYSLRVYFPFEGKCYPSNLVSFDVK